MFVFRQKQKPKQESIGVALLFSLRIENKKAPPTSQESFHIFSKKFQNSYDLSASIFMELDLAPRLPFGGRLLRLHRASPSAFLDKYFVKERGANIELPLSQFFQIFFSD
jgi:hypothetical protein